MSEVLKGGGANPEVQPLASLTNPLKIAGLHKCVGLFQKLLPGVGSLSQFERRAVARIEGLDVSFFLASDPALVRAGGANIVCFTNNIDGGFGG